MSINLSFNEYQKYDMNSIETNTLIDEMKNHSLNENN